jgi:hypothetical protein
MKTRLTDVLEAQNADIRRRRSPPGTPYAPFVPLLRVLCYLLLTSFRFILKLLLSQEHQTIIQAHPAKSLWLPLPT